MKERGWARSGRERPGRRFRKVLAGCLAAGVLFACGGAARGAEDAAVTGTERKMLVPIGKAVGIKLFSDGVVVVGFSQIPAEGGNVVPAKSCGLREGDVITHINAEEVDTIEEVQEQLRQIGGDEMSIRCVRGGKTLQVTARAVKCSTDGTYKLGAWLRDSMAGIGTVTYWDPATGQFGALGHGVNDVDTALLMPMESGGVLPATVSDVKKGKRGEPGELHGAFDMSRDLGVLTANTSHGIFGVLADGSLARRPAVEVAGPSQVRQGPAVICSNVAGDEVKEYTVEIIKLFPDARDGRDMMLRVTDPELLDATGGIVQGMVVRYNRDNTGKP